MSRSDTPAAAPLAEIRRLIERSRSVLVLSHIDPDGDSLGTQLAVAEHLRRLGKQVHLVRENGIPSKYAFLKGVNDIPHLDDLMQPIEADTALVLECPSHERLGRCARMLKEHMTVINIDHHPDNSLPASASWIDTARSSVGEMVFEYLEASEAEITPDMAENLYTAILTDTGRFRFSSTGPRTMEIAGRLIECGANPQRITEMVYHHLEPSTLRLLGRVLNEVEFICGRRCCILTLTREMLRSTGAAESEAEGIVDYTMFVRDVCAGALLREVEEGLTKVSLRSRDTIDVGALARALGGGGHANAAGCTVAMSLAQTRQEIVKRLKELTGFHA